MPYDKQAGNPALDQFYTPDWAASGLVDKLKLGTGHAAIDAGCGQGAFLRAIPAHIPAVGIEIDQALAQIARERTNREVIVGDFRTVPFPFQPSHILGNPVFSKAILDGFLQRAAQELPPDGIAAFLLPTASLSFSGPIERLRSIFSIKHELIPRNLFPRIASPISFVIFTKNYQRRLWGFALFDEAAALQAMPKRIRLVLENGRPGRRTWAAAVDEALTLLGGEATLEQLYALLEPNKPTATQFWRDVTRRELHTGDYTRVGPGRWRKNDP